MSNFNIGIDCPTPEDARILKEHVESLSLYQSELDVCDERVSLVSKQSLLAEIESFAKAHRLTLYLEVWPEGQDYDEAESSGGLEFFTFE